MSVEFKGDEFLYLVEVPDEVSPFRLFNQTEGDTDVEAGEIELNTKDKTGADYGNVTQTISVGGIITEGDEAAAYIKRAQRTKKFVRIIEVNTRTKDTEEGIYMITGFNRSYANEEFAEYSLEAKLNSTIIEGTLDAVPEGAPENELEGTD